MPASGNEPASNTVGPSPVVRVDDRGVDAVGGIVADAGLDLIRTWSAGDRWFARIDMPHRRAPPPLIEVVAVLVLGRLGLSADLDPEVLSSFSRPSQRFESTSQAW